MPFSKGVNLNPPGQLATSVPGGAPGAAGGGNWSYEDAEHFARHAIWYTHPSPLVQPPFRGRYREFPARVVIGPAASGGDVDAATGAIEIANAESALTGTVVPVATPATPASYVTILSFNVPNGQAYLIHAVGAWGHDYIGTRDATVWRVRVGDRIELDNRELGILGEIENPAKIQALAYSGELVVVEAQNRDIHSATLINFRMTGWLFPVGQRNEDDFWSLVRPASGSPYLQSRLSQATPGGMGGIHGQLPPPGLGRR
jgi:hypothetical protein